MGEECEPDQHYQYELRGVVIHSGTSEAGHYYSFIKEEDSRKWYEFNDELIAEMDYRKVEEEGFGGLVRSTDPEHRYEKKMSAYMLFYQKTQSSKE
jgi:ubiquitin C-terminal hydrolase